MINVKSQIDNLVAAGAKQHPDVTKQALKELANCTSYDEIDTTIDDLPDSCHAWAKAIMRHAKKQNISPMMVLNHLDDARMKHMPTRPSVSEQVNFFGGYGWDYNNPADYPDLIDFSSW